MKPIRFVLTSIMLVTGVLALSSCTTTHRYLNSNLEQPVEMRDSDYHAFSYVRAFKEGESLVIYGKADHRHIDCSPEGAVNIVVLDDKGDTVYKASLPMVNRGQHRKGWRGAHFRAKLPKASTIQGKIVLTFNDKTCRSGQPYIYPSRMFTIPR